MVRLDYLKSCDLYYKQNTMSCIHAKKGKYG